MQLDDLLAKVQAFAELEQAGANPIRESDDRIKVVCPFHNDDRPSLTVYTDNNTFKCFGCQKHGDLLTLLVAITGRTRQEYTLKLHREYNLDETKILDSAHILRYHEAIGSAGKLLHELKIRAIGWDIIRRRKLGVHNDRVTIPIPDRTGMFVNIRGYLPGAAEKKMVNVKGRSKMRLYPYDQLKFDTIMFCGGEIKALAAIEQLNPINIGAISTTGGEGGWSKSFEEDFRGKHVIICLDIDEAGRRATQILARYLSSIAASVKILKLPLNASEFPKGDINDYIAGGGDLCGILDTAYIWQHDDQPEVLEEAEIVEKHFDEVKVSSNLGVRVKFDARIVALGDTSFNVPSAVSIKCPQESVFCALCDVSSWKGKHVHKINMNGVFPVEVINSSSKMGLQEAVRNEIGIPTGCRLWSHETKETTKVFQAAIQASAPNDLRDQGESSHDSPSPPMYFIGMDSGLTRGDFSIVATEHATSFGSRAVLTTTTFTPLDRIQDVLENDADLATTRLEDVSLAGIESFLENRYALLSQGVTRIFDRFEMHLLVDLTYHSVLHFTYEGAKTNGWMFVLFIGATETGKSTLTERLRRHYGFGSVVDCKNASDAGVLGGVARINGINLVKHGALVENDSSLLILEEIAGQPTLFNRLTQARTSGVCKVTKIASGEAPARTRVVAACNPRSVARLTSTHPILALPDLVPDEENIRRIDLVMTLSPRVVKHDLPRIEVPDELRDAHRKRVAWVWTRKQHHVEFCDGVESLIRDEAERISIDYHSDVPLVSGESFREKFARMCVALAALTGTTDIDEEKIIVHKAHVEYMAQFIDKLYEPQGYKTYATRYKKRLTLDASCAKQFEHLLKNGDINALLKQTLQDGEYFSDGEFRTICGRGEVREYTLLLNRLIENRIVTKNGHHSNKFVSTPAAQKFLNEFEFEIPLAKEEF